jgi:hypothetical protein
MYYVFKYLKLSFLFFWEIPQNLLGLIVLSVMKYKQRIINTKQDTHRKFIETPHTGVSLGWFIFWTPSGNRFPHLANDCRMHEFGHARQSVMLGPLYLLIVGIPSLCRVAYSYWYRKKYNKNWENYFDGFPENWADRLGGVSKIK